MQAAFPGAVAEAEQLHQRMDQDLEAGEMPPLPSDEIVPAPSVEAVAQANSITAEQPSTPAGNPAAIDLAEPSGSREAPPLPADTPPSAASASTASSDQPPAAAAVGNATAAHEAAVTADHDDDADMELDMDVDVSPEARVSRADSAEAAGTGAAGASSTLPNWAGYYMAHGYTYPYYGVPSKYYTMSAITLAPLRIVCLLRPRCSSDAVLSCCTVCRKHVVSPKQP